MNGEIATIPPCYQCGHTELALAEDAADDGWIVCDVCKARVIQVSEFRAMAERNIEARARNALGVDDWRRKRPAK